VKILRVIARLNIGGPARHVILLNRGLAGAGHSTVLVHGLVGPGEAGLEHLAAQEQLQTIRIPELGRRVSPFNDVRALLHLVALLFRESPDVVHTHTAKAGTLGRIAALAFNLTRGRRRRCLVVHTFHGHVLEAYFSPVVSGLVRVAERGLAAFSDRIVTISERQRADISHRFRIAGDGKTVVVPLGLELRDLLAAPSEPHLRETLGIPMGDVVVGYVGRFVPVKDLGTLVRAFALALRQQPNLWLMLAGDGQSRGDVEAAARHAGVTARTRLLGWNEDLPRIYAAMDVCAMSSLAEGTPVSIIEAMAAGKVVAATNVGGVADVVEDRVTGVLTPPGNAEALASALVQLARDPETRQRMGAAGRERARNCYTAERLVRDVEVLYRDGLAQKRA